MCRISALTLLLLSWMAAGCTHTSGKIHAAEDWASARHQLGRTVVIVKPETPTLFRDSVPLFKERAGDALRELPSLTLVAEKPVLDRLLQGRDEMASPLGDMEAIEAARAEGIDTVCLLMVEDYTYVFGLGVGLIALQMKADGRLNYSLRVLDVDSGRLLLESRRACVASGRSLQDFIKQAPGILGDDLTVVLGPGDTCDSAEQAPHPRSEPHVERAAAVGE